MQFQMSYIPKLAERLVVILDDHPDVWQRSSDRRLVDMFPVRPQQYVTSDQSRKPWLQRFATLALRLHQLAFTQPVLERPLPDIKQDIANEQLRSCLLY